LNISLLKISGSVWLGAKEKASFDNFTYFFYSRKIILLRSKPSFGALPIRFKNLHNVMGNASNTIIVMVRFIYKFILTQFGCLLILVSDQGTHFLNKAIEILTNHFLLRHTTLTTYYPQGNGQVESTNKVTSSLSTKLVSENCTNWDEHLHTVL
jgi:hypothetical protein